MNIGEIARRAGVSRSTVSYAVSGKRTVSPATQRRIQAVIDELDYRPNAAARALKEGRIRILGLVIPPASLRLTDCSWGSSPAWSRPPPAQTSTSCSRPRAATTTGPSNGSSAAGSAKILVGGGTTGNIAVNLQRLDTTSGIVQNNQVRVLAQRIPFNGGGAVQGPVTIQNSVLTLSNNGVSTADGAVIQQWTSLGGALNQQFTLQKVTYAGYDAHDYQLVARHSGKCVDVSGISTAARALGHQWTCNPAGQASPLTQTWRLWGRINSATPNSATAAALPGRHR